MPLIKHYEQTGNWKFLGNLDLTQMAAYYPNLDVLVVPSLNSTEAFGLVQIEAMLNGTPCVASALPGVRQPKKYQADPETIRPRYDPDTIADAYEQLFQKLMLEKQKGN